eukprot:g8925.t1
MVMSLYFDQSSFCFWRLDGLRQCNKAEQVESTRKRQHEVLKAERPEGLSRHGDMVRIVGDGDWCHDSLGCFPALPVLEVKKVKVGGKAWQMATTGTWRTPNSDLGALTRKKDVAWFDSSAFGRSQSSAPRGPSPTFLCKDGHASFFSKWHQLTIDIGTRRC